MSKTIAFAGKGGTGKTTVASLTLRALVKAGLTPVLGVDADPNSCLGETFGIKEAKTIGQIREKFGEAKMNMPPGMSKESIFDMMANEIVVEGKGWDLLVMGRPEGPGCYCFVNNILRKFLETLGGNYKYVIIDHEAGMEHLSRHNTVHADFLIVVAEPTVTSLRAAKRIGDLSYELGLSIGKRMLVLNMVEGEAALEDKNLKIQIESTGLEAVAQIPYDAELERADVNKIPFMNLNDDLISVKSVEKLVKIIS